MLKVNLPSLQFNFSRFRIVFPILALSRIICLYIVPATWLCSLFLWVKRLVWCAFFLVRYYIVQLLGQSSVIFSITPATLCHLLFLVSYVYYLYFGSCPWFELSSFKSSLGFLDPHTHPHPHTLYLVFISLQATVLYWWFSALGFLWHFHSHIFCFFPTWFFLSGKGFK